MANKVSFKKKSHKKRNCAIFQRTSQQSNPGNAAAAEYPPGPSTMGFNVTRPNCHFECGKAASSSA